MVQTYLPTLGLRRFLAGFLLAFALVYPQVFYVQKYNVPWTGMNDFARYHDMVREPLDFDVTPAVFAIRQFTPLLASVIHGLGAHPPNEIWFENSAEYGGRVYDKDIFFALILANFLGLCTACGLVYAAVARIDTRASGLVSLLAGAGVMLLLLAGNTIFYVLSPLTGGWTWAFAAAIYLLARRGDRWRWAVLPLLAVSIFQRELLCIAFAAWAGVMVLLQPAARWRMAVVLAGASVAFLCYLLLRQGLSLQDQHSGQITPAYWLHSLRRLPEMLHQPWFAMGVLKLNLFGAWLCAVLAVLATRGAARDERALLQAILFTAAVLLLVSVLTRNTAPDRVIMTIAPVYAITLMEMLQAHLLKRRPGAAVSGSSKPGFQP